MIFDIDGLMLAEFHLGSAFDVQATRFLESHVKLGQTFYLCLLDLMFLTCCNGEMSCGSHNVEYVIVFIVFS